MPDRVACRVENVGVRAEHRETVEDLIYMLFERRHHHMVGGQGTDWLTVELVQSLREESNVYREELSTEISGPLPFALGYFRLRDDALELTTNEVPANMAPKAVVRFLSEFVEPCARFWFGEGIDAEGWEVRGVDDLKALDGRAPS